MENRKDKFKRVVLPVVELAVATGVTLLCDSVLKEYVPEQEKMTKRVLVGIGSWAVSNYVGTKVTEHISDKASETIDQVDATLTEFKEATKTIKGVK